MLPFPSDSILVIRFDEAINNLLDRNPEPRHNNVVAVSKVFDSGEINSIWPLTVSWPGPIMMIIEPYHFAFV